MAFLRKHNAEFSAVFAKYLAVLSHTRLLLHLIVNAVL